MRNGFTLIELLVSIAIMAILSSALFMQRGMGEKKLALQTAAFTLGQDLRDIQEMAMGAGEATCGGGDKTFDFGINFFKTPPFSSYLLFADCDGNLRYQPQDLSVRLATLSKEVQICDIYPDQSGLDIVFTPPDPLVFINRPSFSGEAVITLCLRSDPSIIKRIKVNEAGRVSIE